MNGTSTDNLLLTRSDALFVTSLIEANGQSIKNVIYTILGSTYHYLAQDAISELYLLMCERVDVLKEHPCPKAWLLVAAKRTALGVIGKSRKDLALLPLDEAINIGTATDVFNLALYDMWLEEKVPEKLIASLTPREREIYCKIYIEGKKQVEVAKELGISPNTVHAINKNLRDKIEDKVRRHDF